MFCCGSAWGAQRLEGSTEREKEREWREGRMDWTKTGRCRQKKTSAEKPPLITGAQSDKHNQRAETWLLSVCLSLLFPPLHSFLLNPSFFSSPLSFPSFEFLSHSSAHPLVPLLLTHTQSKHHECGSIRSMSVHASSSPTPHGWSAPSLFCLLCLLRLLRFIVSQQDGYCLTSYTTHVQPEQHISEPYKLFNSSAQMTYHENIWGHSQHLSFKHAHTYQLALISTLYNMLSLHLIIEIL